MKLICPVCSAKLELDAGGKNLRCAAGHSFDKAKQGYWNLLLVQSKRSKDPGDNPEMVRARTRFLDADFYRPVLEQLVAVLDTQLSSSAKIVDLGCGEGYYTAGLRQHRLTQGFQDQVLGLDISKHAVRAAARRDKQITWIVGSSARIPVPDQSIDLALIIFSKVLSAPLERALKPGALLLIAYPGTNHLMSLRKLIYDEVREKSSAPDAHLSEDFQRVTEAGEPFEITLKGTEQICDLLAMTPHGQRIKEANRAEILNQPTLTTCVDIRLALFRYQPDVPE